MHILPLNVTSRRVLDFTSNTVLALFYVTFVYLFMNDFIRHHRVSSLLFVFVETVFVYFAMSRRSPREVSRSAPVWFFAFAGALLPMLVRPTSHAETLLGQAFQVAGVILVGFSILSLGKSFGMVAANRGVVTTGMYKYVRHPLYISYLVSQVGFLQNSFSVYNAVIIALGFMTQLIRIRDEEKLLLNDEEYQEYAQTVKWRLVPYIY